MQAEWLGFVLLQLALLQLFLDLGRMALYEVAVVKLPFFRSCR